MMPKHFMLTATLLQITITWQDEKGTQLSLITLLLHVSIVSHGKWIFLLKHESGTDNWGCHFAPDQQAASLQIIKGKKVGVDRIRGCQCLQTGNSRSTWTKWKRNRFPTPVHFIPQFITSHLHSIYLNLSFTSVFFFLITILPVS